MRWSRPIRIWLRPMQWTELGDGHSGIVPWWEILQFYLREAEDKSHPYPQMTHELQNLTRLGSVLYIFKALGSRHAEEQSKWGRRDRKKRKKRHGMQTTGRSVFTIQEQLRKRGKKT